MPSGVVSIVSAGWEIVSANFRAYFGGSFQLLLYGGCLLFLLGMSVRERRLDPVAAFNALCLLLLFNPVSAWLLVSYVLEKASSEGTFWRALWVLPLPFTLAYAAVRAARAFRAKALRYIAVLLLLSCLIGGGLPLLSREYFTPADNLYKIPYEVLQALRILDARGEGTRAVFPLELSEYTHQVENSVVFAYGRNGSYYRKAGKEGRLLAAAMRAERLDAPALAKLMRAGEYAYLVAPKSKKWTSSPASAGFSEVGETDSYVVFYLDAGGA